MSEFILSNFAMHITLAPEEKEQALALLQRKIITKRTFLLRPGEVDRNIYFVNKGCLRMFNTDQNGNEHTICFYPENWWVCDIVSFFKEKPSMNSIQVLEDSEVYYFTLPRLEELFLKVPKFERFFRILTQNGFEMYQRRITSNLSRTAEQRYREFRKQYPGLEQRIAQKHIAGYVGITPVFLSMMRKNKNL
ncbi:cAMP-binding domain of CRP or a regulatory subunit of cAMP-dependent protein kinases [Pedobacter westerhofensis]|uniref:cAMP-binding domain of CRP or a regulatory subunit of cAMP-dependent protein kinases n=2 Tax=Pedobacter westerhofensis TaxID=425512 RepID=A0A521F5M8_9SPHI|nr:cAMP-binding domain of CRP or a regulatory subunit of cAMP-dependent protein kinases [Pedobacter westerhofensis]